MPPPMRLALLPLNVAVVMVRAPPLIMPPASRFAKFPLTVLLLICSCPELETPPPVPEFFPAASLPLTVLFLISRIPLLAIPPPKPEPSKFEPAWLASIVLSVIDYVPRL